MDSIIVIVNISKSTVLTVSDCSLSSLSSAQCSWSSSRAAFPTINDDYVCQSYTDHCHHHFPACVDHMRVIIIVIAMPIVIIIMIIFIFIIITLTVCAPDRIFSGDNPPGKTPLLLTHSCKMHFNIFIIVKYLWKSIGQHFFHCQKSSQNAFACPSFLLGSWDLQLFGAFIPPSPVQVHQKCWLRADLWSTRLAHFLKTSS